MSARCVACGMPMESAADHASGDLEKDYCIHCTRPDGSMQSYQEKLESMVQFIARSEGLTNDRAREKAMKWLTRQPAWQGRTSPYNPVPHKKTTDRF